MGEPWRVGEGGGVGYRRIEVEVEPHEWEVFRPVNRDRGDALLAMMWTPTPRRAGEPAGETGKRADGLGSGRAKEPGASAP